MFGLDWSNIVEMSTLLRAIYRLNIIPTKIPMAYFIELEQILPKFVQNHKRSHSQSNLEKEQS